MFNQKNMQTYQVRTDLAIEALEGIDNKDGIISDIEKIEDMQVTTVEVLEAGTKTINKKQGKYITIEFTDVTDFKNKELVKDVFAKHLKKLLNHSKIKENDTCLIVGLGNNKSTPDSLGPAVIDRVVVTKHLFNLGTVEDGFRAISAFSPGVMGQTGIETSEIIFGVVNEVKPDFLIVIDALASNSIARINKTIQMTDSGIHPGSGVGNARKEISRELLNIPVIAVGIPTVVDAVTIVSDTINYMTKQFAYNKDNIDNPIHKLVPSSQIDYLQADNGDLSDEDKENLMGIIGTLSEEEMKQLVYEVLSPIGYNMMVTPKEIDFLIEKLSEVLAGGINNTLHRQINHS